jgi:hypothetical protein
MRVELCRFRAFAGLLREAGHDPVILPRGAAPNIGNGTVTTSSHQLGEGSEQRPVKRTII